MDWFEVKHAILEGYESQHEFGLFENILITVSLYCLDTVNYITFTSIIVTKSFIEKFITFEVANDRIW